MAENRVELSDQALESVSGGMLFIDQDTDGAIVLNQRDKNFQIMRTFTINVDPHEIKADLINLYHGDAEMIDYFLANNKISVKKNFV